MSAKESGSPSSAKPRVTASMARGDLTDPDLQLKAEIASELAHHSPRTRNESDFQ